MATKNTQDQTNAADASTATADERSYAPTQEHVWEVKGTGTEIHKRYDGLKLRQVLAGYGRTPEEAMQNMLARCGGNWHAVTDLFNSAFRLAGQKDAKDAPMGTRTVKETVDGKEITRTVEPTVTAEQLQSRLLAYVGQEITRKGQGEGAKRREEKQKASMLDQLAGMDEDAALDLLRQLRERRGDVAAARQG